jgi:hypothetical protein
MSLRTQLSALERSVRERVPAESAEEFRVARLRIQARLDAKLRSFLETHGAPEALISRVAELERRRRREAGLEHDTPERRAADAALFPVTEEEGDRARERLEAELRRMAAAWAASGQVPDPARASIMELLAVFLYGPHA